MISAWTALAQKVYSQSEAGSGNSLFNFGYGNSGSRSISPTKMKRALNAIDGRIGSGRQEDAFFVIVALLEGLDDEMSETDGAIEHMMYISPEDDASSSRHRAKIANLADELWQSYNDNVVKEHFRGVAVETLACPDCGYAELRFEDFRFIELPLVKKDIALNV